MVKINKGGLGGGGGLKKELGVKMKFGIPKGNLKGAHTEIERANLYYVRSLRIILKCITFPGFK